MGSKYTPTQAKYQSDWRKAKRRGMTVKEYRASLASEGAETIEDEDESASEGDGELQAGNPRKSSEPRPRKAPKATKSALLNQITSHTATMGAQGLQLLTVKTLGTAQMLTPDEAQNMVQPVGRIASRQLARVIVLPNMPGEDAEDVALVVLTLVEYVLRLLAQATNRYVIRFARGERQVVESEPPVAAPNAPREPTMNLDPTAMPVADIIMPSAPADEDSSAATNHQPSGSQIYDMALSMGARPYTGDD